MLKSFKRKMRREQSERVFERRIKTAKTTFGTEDNKLPIKNVILPYNFKNTKDRTNDINVLKTDAHWLKYLKNTPCRFKNKCASYYEKERKHIDKVQKEQMIKDEMEYYENFRVEQNKE